MNKKVELSFHNRDEFVKAVEEFDFVKKANKKDLSSDQDLTIAIMNLISIEEHFFFSGAKEQKTNYYDMIESIREMRKELMQKVVKNPEGEEWCLCKHFLAASMRLMEVGTKQLSMGRKEEAYNMFDKSYELYALFWGLVMKVIDTEGVEVIGEDQLTKKDKPSKGKHSLMSPLGKLVKKIIDCCIE